MNRRVIQTQVCGRANWVSEERGGKLEEEKDPTTLVT